MDSKKLATTALSVTTRTFLFVLILLVLYFVGSKAFAFGSAIFYETGMTTEENAVDVTVTIPTGASLSNIGSILEKKGLIDSSRVFYVQALLSDYKDLMEAGTYTLSTDMTPTQIMSAISPTEAETTEEQ